MNASMIYYTTDGVAAGPRLFLKQLICLVHSSCDLPYSGTIVHFTCICISVAEMSLQPFTAFLFFGSTCRIQCSYLRAADVSENEATVLIQF